jgi:hypothetical protein
MAQVSEHLTSKHEILIPNPYTSIKNADCALWSIGLRHIGPWRVFKIWHGRPWSWSTVEGHVNPGSGSSVHCSLSQHSFLRCPAPTLPHGLFWTTAHRTTFMLSALTDCISHWRRINLQAKPLSASLFPQKSEELDIQNVKHFKGYHKQKLAR